KMEAVISLVQERIHTQLFGVDEQLKCLGDLLDSVRDGQGGSIIVYGQEEDGRSAIVHHALEKHAHGVITHHLWLSRFGTESNALQTLLDSEASKEPRIIVVDSADDLVCKSKQALLYRLLDRAKTGPWLVLLIITNQDMISSLEKRVRSRLPNTRIFTGEAIEEEQWAGFFESLMEREKKEDKSSSSKSKKAKKVKEVREEEGKWAEFIKKFLADEEVKREQRILYKYSGHIAVVKRAINMWLVVVEAEDVEQAVNPDLDIDVSRSAFRRVVDDFRRVVEATVPSRDEVATAMNNLSRRSFCVLTAAARRLRCDPSGTIPYGKIAVDFIHQCNSVDRRMLPYSELQTFKELDRLCEVGLLAAVGSSSHSFRQIALSCPLTLLLSNIRVGCSQSPALMEWFESQPVN
ncbi:hypothetical protein PENTCL1PPCAC_3020, partial [Pristionchus entomophagus]